MIKISIIQPLYLYTSYNGKNRWDTTFKTKNNICVSDKNSIRMEYDKNLWNTTSAHIHIITMVDLWSKQDDKMDIKK